MKTKKAVSPHFAVCIRNTGYPSSLELHKIYRVLPDDDAAEDGDIRVVDESREDYLYPSTWFAELKLPQIIQAWAMFPEAALTITTRARPITHSLSLGKRKLAFKPPYPPRW